MAEFEIAGKQYQSGKWNAFDQFHVARKLGPIFAKLGPNAAAASGEGKSDSIFDVLSPIAEALASMSEEDCNYVLRRCLKVVTRYQGQNVPWAPVWNERAERLMFDDIDLQVMMQIAMNVLTDNLGNFFNAPGLASPQPPSLA